MSSGASAAGIESLLDRAIRAGMAPGLAAGWCISEDRPTVVTAGRSVVDPASEEVADETWFDLASLTKPLVVGTLTVLLVRDGRLKLDTRVAEVLPETSEHDLGERTLEQLLTHSAGMPAWAPLYALAPDGAGAAIEAILELVLDRPGRHVTYSCPGFITLGILVERLTGSSLDRLFSARVLEPLGLVETLGFRPGPGRTVAGGASTPTAEQALVDEMGLDPDAIPPPGSRLPDDGNARFLGGVAGNAGLFGTVAGVVELARASLVPGLLFSADEIALATANRTPELEQGRGLAWQLASSPGCSAGPALSASAFGHSGFTGASVWIDPAREIAMALLSNRNHPGHRLNDLHPLRRCFHRLVVDQVG